MQSFTSTTRQRVRQVVKHHFSSLSQQQHALHQDQSSIKRPDLGEDKILDEFLSTMGGCAYENCSTCSSLFQSFIKRRFSFTAFCACAIFVNINISANAL